MQLEYTKIKKGTCLPNDFVVKGVLNREKYVIEFGVKGTDKWYDEFSSPATAEIIGAIVIGSTIYHDFRFRERTESDETWALHKTLFGKIISGRRF